MGVACNHNAPVATVHLITTVHLLTGLNNVTGSSNMMAMPHALRIIISPFPYNEIYKTRHIFDFTGQIWVQRKTPLVEVVQLLL